MTTGITRQQMSELLDQKLEQKFEQKLAPIYRELKSHGKQLGSLKKDQILILDLLDREQMNQRKRLDRVEQHLGLPTLVS